jgi:hypothetical protein
MSEDPRITPALVAELNSRTAWDEPPDLLFLCLGDQESSHPGEVQLHTLGIRPSFWTLAADPLVLMNAMVQGMAEYDKLADHSDIGFPKPPLPGVPSTFIGVAFRFEAWGLPPEAIESPDPAVRERLRRAWAEHDIHSQPERVEYRQILACGMDGTYYWASQIRGQEVESISRDEDHEPEGRVPEVLSQLTMEFRALLANQ